MDNTITFCNVCELLRKTESGILNQERVLGIVEELGQLATTHPGRCLLIDLRHTRLTAGSMGDIVEAVMRAETFSALRDVKIANVVPDEASRRFIANRVEGLMRHKGFDYRFFTDSQAALDWLAG